MAKNNDHKKVYDIDEFARHYYCQGARLRQLREDKRRAKKRLVTSENAVRALTNMKIMRKKRTKAGFYS